MDVKSEDSFSISPLSVSPEARERERPVDRPQPTTSGAAAVDLDMWPSVTTLLDELTSVLKSMSIR